MDLALSGKLAVIVGASRGIGRAIAKTLASEGAHVVLVARSANQLAAVAAEINAGGGRATSVVLDLQTKDAAQALVATVKERAGAAPIWIWNAATLFSYKKLHNLRDPELDAWLGHELRVPTETAQRVLPEMMLGHFGRFLLIGSLSGRVGAAGALPYSMVKAAMEALARGITIEYARYGITSNVVAPGIVETERLDERVKDDPEGKRRLAAMSPRGRLVQPEEVADAVAFLCSPRAGAISGTVIDVNAGLHLGHRLGR